ncbi:MAG: DUF1156 domain-containing protein [Gammaproteobacteria bacterium]
MNRTENIPATAIQEPGLRYETRPAAVQPFSLKNAPSLIERLLPAQKISSEAQKERKAGAGQTLTALGSYWKGRKPLILARACVLGALLPASDDPKTDLEIFEKLMAIDDEAFLIRADGMSARTIVERLQLEDPSAYFLLSRKTGEIPRTAPVDLDLYPGLTVRWKREVTEAEKTWLKRRVLAEMTYSEKLEFSKRPEEIDAKLYRDIWEEVNAHLGTSAYSHAELIEPRGQDKATSRPPCRG